VVASPQKPATGRLPRQSRHSIIRFDRRAFQINDAAPRAELLVIPQRLPTGAGQDPDAAVTLQFSGANVVATELRTYRGKPS